MKITLAQINPTVGDIAGNSKKILSIIKKSKADLIVFPELALTGYCPQDLILKEQFIAENLEALQNLAKNTKKNVLVGFIDRKAGKLYNAVAFISEGRVKATYYKQDLPNYSVFDEKRWFSAGVFEKTITVAGKKIGLTICEDIWTGEVCRQLPHDTDLIVNLSASPYSMVKASTMEHILLERYTEFGTPIIYVNQVGAQDGLVYYGHSMVVNKNKVVKRAKDFVEDIITITL